MKDQKNTLTPSVPSHGAIKGVRHRPKSDKKPAPWKTPPFTLTEFWESCVADRNFLAGVSVIEETKLRGFFFLGAATYPVILKNNFDRLLIGNMDERNRKLEPYLIRKFRLCRTVIARTGAQKVFERAAEGAFVMGGLCMPLLVLSFNDDAKSVGQKKYDTLCREINAELGRVAQKLSDTQPNEPCPCGSGKAGRVVEREQRLKKSHKMAHK